jgi:hypothetical protein
MIRDLRGNYNLGGLGAYVKGIDGFVAGGCFRSILVAIGILLGFGGNYE